MTEDQIALLNYIKSENAKIASWVEEGPGRFAGIICEDLEMWEKDGVFTVEDFIKYDYAVSLYEHTKAEFGYKRNWQEMMSMTVEQLKEELSTFGNYNKYPWE
jgi:hypothetical protein